MMGRSEETFAPRVIEIMKIQKFPAQAQTKTASAGIQPGKAVCVSCAENGESGNKRKEVQENEKSWNDSCSRLHDAGHEHDRRSFGKQRAF
jgi:hypothetical protein